jgi:hypothetical protein
MGVLAACGGGGAAHVGGGADPSPFTHAWKVGTVRGLVERVKPGGAFPVFLRPSPVPDVLKLSDATIAGEAIGVQPTRGDIAVLDAAWSPRRGLFHIDGIPDLYTTSVVVRALEGTTPASLPVLRIRAILASLRARKRDGGFTEGPSQARPSVEMTLFALRAVTELEPAAPSSMKSSLRQLTRFRGAALCSAAMRSSDPPVVRAATAIELLRYTGGSCSPAATRSIHKTARLAARAIPTWTRGPRTVETATLLAALATLARARQVSEFAVGRALDCLPRCPTTAAVGRFATLEELITAEQDLRIRPRASTSDRRSLQQTLTWQGRLPDVVQPDVADTLLGLRILAELDHRAMTRTARRVHWTSTALDPASRLALTLQLLPDRVDAPLVLAVLRTAHRIGWPEVTVVSAAVLRHPDLCGNSAISAVLRQVGAQLGSDSHNVASAREQTLIDVLTAADAARMCDPASHAAVATALIARNLAARRLPDGTYGGAPHESADMMSTWSGLEARCLLGLAPSISPSTASALVRPQLRRAGGTLLGAPLGGDTLPTYAALRIVALADHGCTPPAA